MANVFKPSLKPPITERIYHHSIYIMDKSDRLQSLFYRYFALSTDDHIILWNFVDQQFEEFFHDIFQGIVIAMQNWYDIRDKETFPDKDFIKNRLVFTNKEIEAREQVYLAMDILLDNISNLTAMEDVIDDILYNYKSEGKTLYDQHDRFSTFDRPLDEISNENILFTDCVDDVADADISIKQKSEQSLSSSGSDASTSFSTMETLETNLSHDKDGSGVQQKTSSSEKTTAPIFYIGSDDENSHPKISFKGKANKFDSYQNGILSNGETRKYRQYNNYISFLRINSRAHYLPAPRDDDRYQSGYKTQGYFAPSDDNEPLPETSSSMKRNDRFFYRSSDNRGSLLEYFSKEAKKDSSESDEDF